MLVGADETDLGMLDWSVTATIAVRPGDEETEPAWLSTPSLALWTTDHADGTRELVILEADGLIVSLDSAEDVVGALDVRSADYEHLTPLFGTTRSFGIVDLDDSLEDTLEVLGSQVVIIDRVRIASAWRGLGGVGRLLTGRLLRWVGADAPGGGRQSLPHRSRRSRHEGSRGLCPRPGAGASGGGAGIHRVH